LLIGDLRHVADSTGTAADLLRRFGLEEAADRRVSTFSGGMRRRLDMAMSLIGSPAVIFLDEPTTGFDPQARNEMWRTIHKLAQDGTTVLLTTQHLEEADELADHIAVLHQGRIVASGTAGELKKLVPSGLIELTFHDEEARDAAAQVLGKSYAQAEGEGATLTITTDGTVAHVAGNLRGTRGCSDRADRVLPESGYARRRVPQDNRRRAGGRMRRTLADTWTLAKRSLRHITRSPDTVITVLLMPIALMLLFVYVWGGSLGQQTGSVSTIDFIVPGIVRDDGHQRHLVCRHTPQHGRASGIINRFRTMPVAPSSILGGQVASSTLSNLFSSLLVLSVAFAIGFRSQAGVMGGWSLPGSCCCSRLQRRGSPSSSACLPDDGGAGAFSYVLILLIFISPAFVADELHDTGVAGFAENQPMTPVVENDAFTAGQWHGRPQAWTAIAWILGLLVASYLLSVQSTNAKRSW